MITRWFKELNYFVTAVPDGYRVDFKVYKVIGEEDGKPLFNTSSDPSTEPDQDSLDLEGSVKWDGCSNWRTNEDCMLHGCYREDLINVGLIMAECWTWTAELLPTWDKSNV